MKKNIMETTAQELKDRGKNPQQAYYILRYELNISIDESAKQIKSIYGVDVFPELPKKEVNSER